MTNETEEEFDIAAAFGATMLGQKFAIYVPSADRNDKPFDQKPWVELVLKELSKISTGATAMPPLRGVWYNEETDHLIEENPVIVYVYIDPDRFIEQIDALIALVKRIGKETNQDAMAFEFDNDFFLLDDYT